MLRNETSDWVGTADIGHLKIRVITGAGIGEGLTAGLSDPSLSRWDVQGKFGAGRWTRGALEPAASLTSYKTVCMAGILFGQFYYPNLGQSYNLA